MEMMSVFFSQLKDDGDDLEEEKEEDCGDKPDWQH